MRWFFIILYWLVGIITSAAVFFLVIISQTGNVGIREDANSIAWWGFIAIIFCTCFSASFARKCKEIKVKTLCALTLLIFLNPIFGYATLYFVFTYGF